MYRATEKTRANAQKRRDNIAEAARQQIIVGGFRSATVKAVANRAGCSAGLIYQYFSNAEELLKGAFAHVSEYELAIFRKGLNQHEDIGTAIDTGVEIFIGRSLAGPALADALLFEALPQLVAEERLLFRRKWAAAIADRLELAMARGQLSNQNSAIVSTALTGALAENLLPRLHGNTAMIADLPVATLIAELQALCRSMIGLITTTKDENDNVS